MDRRYRRDETLSYAFKPLVHAREVDCRAGTVDNRARTSDPVRVGECLSRAGLTVAEERLLPLLATPLSLAQIASLLEVPRDEVEVYATAIYSKLGLRSPHDSH
jgi:DNA-binding NarL/FixJ family response regulator